VRPYVFEHLILSETLDESGLDPKDPKLEEAVDDYLELKVNELIQRAKDEHPHHYGPGVDETKLRPLIRLRVEHTGFCTVNRQRFGQKFVDRVANPVDILQFHKEAAKREKKAGAAKENEADEEELHGLMGENDQPSVANIVDLVDVSSDMQVLPQMEMKDAVSVFVDKEDNDAIRNFVEKELRKTQDYLRKEDAAKTLRDAEDLGTEAEAFNRLLSERCRQADTERRRKDTQASAEASQTQGTQATQATQGKGARRAPNSDDDDDDEDDAEMMGSSMPSQRATASRAAPARGSARSQTKATKQSTITFGKATSSKATPATKNKRKQRAESSDEDEDEVSFDEEDEEDATPAKKRKTAAASSKAKAKQPAAATLRKKKAAEPPTAKEQTRNRGGSKPVNSEIIDLDDDDDDQSVQGMSTVSTGARKWGRR